MPKKAGRRASKLKNRRKPGMKRPETIAEDVAEQRKILLEREEVKAGRAARKANRRRKR